MLSFLPIVAVYLLLIICSDFLVVRNPSYCMLLRDIGVLELPVPLTRASVLFLFFFFFQVVRSAATSGAGSTTSGVVSGSLGSREINYILRVLGPAACRNPEIFTEVANSCIRIALPAPRGSGTGK